MNASKTIRTVLAIQVGIGLLVAVIAFWFAGTRAAFSACIGGGINVIGTAYFAYKTFSAGPGSTAKKMLTAFYMAELIKIVLTAVLFTLALVWLDVSFPPLFSAYVATLLAFWLALPLTLTDSTGNT